MLGVIQEWDLVLTFETIGLRLYKEMTHCPDVLECQSSGSPLIHLPLIPSYHAMLVKIGTCRDKKMHVCKRIFIEEVYIHVGEHPLFMGLPNLCSKLYTKCTCKWLL